MLRLALMSMFTAGMLGTFVAADSLAVFTDTKANGGNAFSTGILQIDDVPAAAVVTFATMAPGDSVIAGLVINNSGTLALRYAMSGVTTNFDGKGLADQLQLTIRVKTGNACAAEDGVIIYGPGALSAGAFGSNAQGDQPCDRTLAASANETLCFKVLLPLATGNAYQNATTTATFTFDAEQTANNP